MLNTLTLAEAPEHLALREFGMPVGGGKVREGNESGHHFHLSQQIRAKDECGDGL